MSPPRFRLPQKQKDDAKSSSPPGNDPFSSVPRFSTRQDMFATPTTFSSYRNLSLNRTESIQDAGSTQDVSQSDLSCLEGHRSDDEEMLFDTHNENEINTDSPLSKRRKLSNGNEILENYKLPFSPKQPGFSVNRFIPTASKATTADEHAETLPRPMFIVPSQAAGSIEATLPSVFSPQRTTQRLLPSGLASSLRTEIMELTSFKGGQSLGYIPSGTKVNTVKVYPMAGYTAVQGHVFDGSSVDLLLFGTGQNVTAGNVLILKGINWSVEIQSKMWVVVLDWTVDD
jgi:hypothetical protein